MKGALEFEGFTLSRTITKYVGVNLVIKCKEVKMSNHCRWKNSAKRPSSIYGIDYR